MPSSWNNNFNGNKWKPPASAPGLTRLFPHLGWQGPWRDVLGPDATALQEGTYFSVHSSPHFDSWRGADLHQAHARGLLRKSGQAGPQPSGNACLRHWGPPPRRGLCRAVGSTREHGLLGVGLKHTGSRGHWSTRVSNLNSLPPGSQGWGVWTGSMQRGETWGIKGRQEGSRGLFTRKTERVWQTFGLLRRYCRHT